VKIAFDLDGTLARETPGKEGGEIGEPIFPNIDLAMKWMREGNLVFIFTARGWWEYEVIRSWMEKNGLKDAVLVCGKLHADIYFDDRGRQLDENTLTGMKSPA
jgi:hydroxymethylpyrimidine pyrophosphatase-like HAD family hydrolase